MKHQAIKRSFLALLAGLLFCQWSNSDAAIGKAVQSVESRIDKPNEVAVKEQQRLAEGVASPKGWAFPGDAGIRYGDVIRIKHNETKGLYLTSGTVPYTHPKTSGQNIVYTAAEKGDDTLWIVKGEHKDGDRWNCQLGDLVKLNDKIRLENVATHNNLHAHNLPSPVTHQGEVTSYGVAGIGDSNDNWNVFEVTPGSRGVLCREQSVKFMHSNIKRALHSHGRLLDASRNRHEVTTYDRRDNNDWFYVELVTSVAQNTDDAIKKEFEKVRDAKLTYNSLIFIDPASTGNDAGGMNRRLWTHGGSAFVDIDLLGKLSSLLTDTKSLKKAYELLSGPWSDQRVQGSASWFLIKNATDESRSGVVKYGDSIKIYSVFAGAGEPLISGVIDPIKPWTMQAHQQWGPHHPTIMIRDMNDQDVASGNGIFKLEPTLVGLEMGDEVAESDLVQIRSMWDKKGVLWLNTWSRWGGAYSEILANNNDDNWGMNTQGCANHRNQLFHRFSLHSVKKENVPAWADSFLSKITSDNKIPLPGSAGSENRSSVKAKEAAENLKIKQELDKKAAEERRKIDELAALQQQLAHVVALPVGFVSKPGELQSVAAGINQFWGVTVDNKLVQMVPGVNPWMLVAAKDEAGKEIVGFKSVSVGTDGTICAVLEDGSVYQYFMPERNVDSEAHEKIESEKIKQQHKKNKKHKKHSTKQRKVEKKSESKAKNI